jgi:hypothetical protein
MGKLVGIAGTLRGKVGAFVFTKGENGQTYAKSYQPQVANPKSEGQLRQRAKMNVVGRISSLVPNELLVGLTGNKRARRSVFNKQLLSVATVDDSVQGTFTASVAPEDVVFSRGESMLHAAITTPASTQQQSMSIGLELTDADLANKYGERVIVVVVDPHDKGGVSLVRFTDVVFDGTTEKTVSIAYGMDIESRSLVAVYRVPFMLSDKGSNVFSSSIANDNESMIAKLMLGAENVDRWGASAMAAKLVFTTA